MSHWLSFYNKPGVSFEQSLSEMFYSTWFWWICYGRIFYDDTNLVYKDARICVWFDEYPILRLTHRIIWSYSNRKSGRLVGVATKTAISVPPQFSGLTRFTHERGLVLSECVIPAGPCRSHSSKNPGSYQGWRLCYIVLQRYLQGKDD